MSEALAEDRLSSLPDDLLTNHILSLLSTKQSVSTIVLSTRWKNLFKSVPVLDFNTKEFPNREVACCSNFPEFIKNVLRLHNLPTIESCRLYVNCAFNGKIWHFTKKNGNISHPLDSWISALSSRHPRQVDLKIGHHAISTPISLLTSSSLVHLKLKGNFMFSNVGTVHLPSLKTLNIKKCTFTSNVSATRLLSGCPVLEDLVLSSIRLCNVDVISVTAPWLKRLTMYDPDTRRRIKWTFNVQSLEDIDVELDAIQNKLSFVTILNYLRKARINLEDDDTLWGLVMKFKEVQFLSLCSLSKQPIASDSISLPLFNKLTSLELRNFQNCWKFFPKLLERAPSLELLVIDEDPPRFSSFDDELPANTLVPQEVPLCFSQFLKKVEICMFEKEEFKYEWLGYLLKNGKVLQKLTVSLRAYEDGPRVNLKTQIEMKKKLLALPKASDTCKIVVTFVKERS